MAGCHVRVLGKFWPPIGSSHSIERTAFRKDLAGDKELFGRDEPLMAFMSNFHPIGGRSDSVSRSSSARIVAVAPADESPMPARSVRGSWVVESQFTRSFSLLSRRRIAVVSRVPTRSKRSFQWRQMSFA